VPVFSSLQHGFPCNDYIFVKGVPSELNKLLSSGQLDLCPSSSIEYAKHFNQYLIFDHLSISSVGRVKSVFLLSRHPIEKLNGRPIGLTSESDTSVILLKIILERFHSFHNAYEKIYDTTAGSLGSFDAILLIGDTALQAGLKRLRGVYTYDLGEVWYRFTGLPFVFALWIVQEKTVLDKREGVSTLHARLCDAKRRAYDSYESIAEDFGYEWIGREELVSYWKTISYDLTPQHVEGLRLFYRFAAELRLIDREPPIRFFP
jgi:chorismate dehydratase